MITNRNQTMEKEDYGLLIGDFYGCMDKCLTCLHNKVAFQLGCASLCEELKCLNATLTELAERIEDSLPLRSDKARSIDWVDISTRFGQYATTLKQHPLYADTLKFSKEWLETHMGEDADDTDNGGDENAHSGMAPLPHEFPLFLKDRLQESSHIADRIYDALSPVDEGILYVEYLHAEMDVYDLNSWSAQVKRIRRDMSSVSDSHRSEFIDRKIQTHKKTLAAACPDAIDIDKSYIYEESLGRYLWQLETTDDGEKDFTKMLLSLFSLRHFCSIRNVSITFLANDVCDESENDVDSEFEKLRQKVRQNGIPKAIERTKACVLYLVDGYTEDSIGQLWWKFFDSEHARFVCNKLSADVRSKKMTCQFVGELMRLSVLKASASELAECLLNAMPAYKKSLSRDEQKTARKSFAKYIREGFKDNQELIDWMTNNACITQVAQSD